MGNEPAFLISGRMEVTDLTLWNLVENETSLLDHRYTCFNIEKVTQYMIFGTPKGTA
jgi:hypothetical protein